MKYCKLCENNLDESAFGKHAGRKDGLQDHCLVCRRATRTDKARPGYMQEYYLKNKEKIDARNRENYEANRQYFYEVSKEYRREWDRQNKEKRAEYWQRFKVNHPEAYHENILRRRESMKVAMPGWVDKKALSEIYKNRPEGFHVDHIVPLRGENVSGLHVPWNLQYLSAEENLKKSNKIKEL